MEEFRQGFAWDDSVLERVDAAITAATARTVRTRTTIEHCVFALASGGWSPTEIVNLLDTPEFTVAVGAFSARAGEVIVTMSNIWQLEPATFSSGSRSNNQGKATP